MTKSTKVTALHPTPTAVRIRVPLSCHAVHPCPAVVACEVTLERQPAGLALEYALRGDLDSLQLPLPAANTGFADGLWQYTCMEVFIAVPDAPLYREFNFSPAGNWAAYTFSDYRQREQEWRPGAHPRLSSSGNARSWSLSAWIPACLLPTCGELQLGLSAVLETTAGDLSYWALHHPDTKPDFHHRDSFRLTLANPMDSAS